VVHSRAIRGAGAFDSFRGAGSFDLLRKSQDDTVGGLRMTRSRRRGFTLVEILVAVIVMSIALVVLVGAFSGAAGVQRKVKSHALAQNAAQSKLDSLRSGGWEGLSFGTTTESVSGLEDGVMTTTVILEQASLARLTVRVDWGTAGGGEDRYHRGHVEYVSYLAQPQ
jgi:prepilin-type N-terminal cleavage/methylation domain-containing protein